VTVPDTPDRPPSERGRASVEGACAPLPDGLQLRSLLDRSGLLELSLVRVATTQPGADEVVIRVEATPINPSDIGLLFGAADLATLTVRGSGEHTVASARVPDAAMKAMAGRVGQSLPVGNEGAGTVIAAGSAPAAQALLGRTVAVLGGAMYAQYRTVKADLCLPLPPGASAADGASCFVNPLTALGMTETLRREGHRALVHTAAASNLGQMLNRICLADGIGLVNIVRKPEQEALLREQGATHVVSSSSPAFMDELTQAVAATGATLGFDAIGGGRLAGQILTAMEAALSRSATEYSRYGSATHKQVYLYGSLDTGPTEFVRNFGMSWGMGGWLLFIFLQRIGADAAQRLKDRVVAELKTTFASHYTRRCPWPRPCRPTPSPTTAGGRPRPRC
jgi:NADPH2:quinone reductase